MIVILRTTSPRHVTAMHWIIDDIAVLPIATSFGVILIFAPVSSAFAVMEKKYNYQSQTPRMTLKTKRNQMYLFIH